MRLITINILAELNNISPGTINTNIKALLDAMPELREKYERNI